MSKPNGWLNDPINAKLVEFFVERTKNVEKVMSVTGSAREFKDKTNSPLSVMSLQKRIDRFRPSIHLIPKLDNETKVKLMFALSAPVDYGFLNELKKQASVTVDDSNRIVHYKKKRGGIELKGKHAVPRKSFEVGKAEILDFLAKKAQEENGVISWVRLVKEYQEETGNSQNIDYLQGTFRKARDYIYESKLFDEDTKIRMMFATNTKIPGYVLKEIRKNAIVVLDKENCIKEYKKKDGSLNLKKEKNPSEKRKSMSAKDSEDSDKNVEEDDEDDEEGETRDAMKKSGRLSRKKKFPDGLVSMNQNNSDSSTHTTGNKKRKISKNMTRAVRKNIHEETSEDTLDDDFSFDDVSYQSNDNHGANFDRQLREAPENVIDDGEAEIIAPTEQRVKLEPFDGALRDDTSRGNIINDGENFVEEIQAPIENRIVPKQEEMLMEVNMEFLEIKTETENHSEDVITLMVNYVAPDLTNTQQNKDSVEQDRTPLPMVLESLYDFIDILEIPILSDLQMKIKTKLEEFKNNFKIRMVSNKVIFHSMELCLLKVNENWEKEELNGIESLKLKTFLTPFKVIVKCLNVPSLVEFQKKLEEIIEKLRLEEKTVPLTTIRGALQNTIDNLTTF